MEKEVINFLGEHKELIFMAGTFLIGWLLPTPKTYLFGKKIGERIPKKLAISIADRLDSIEQGLRGKEYRGDRNIVSNAQISDEINKAKIDLGLEQSK